MVRARRFVAAPTIRCRSAYWVSMRCNHRLPMIRISPTVPTAASAAKPPRQAPARPIKSKVDGDCRRLPNRRQSGSEDRSNPSRIAAKNSRHPIAQRVQLFKCPIANAGGRGGLPSPFSGVFKRGILFGKRIPLLAGSSVPRCTTSLREVRRMLCPHAAWAQKRAALSGSSFHIFVPYSVTKGSRAI